MLNNFVKYFVLLLVTSFYLNATPLHQVCRGVVINETTNEPISEVLIKLNDQIVCKTNSEGYFEFVNQNSTEVKLTFSRTGYYEQFANVISNIDTSLVVTLKPKKLVIGEIEVVAERNSPNAKIGEVVISDYSLKINLSSNIAKTLNSMPNISNSNMGTVTSRPVYRGFAGSRVVFIQDEFEVNDLSYSSQDHALTADPLSSSIISILNSPEMNLYTTYSSGAIIKVNRLNAQKNFRDSSIFDIRLLSESFNNGINASINSIIPISNFNIISEVVTKNTENMATPVGVLMNTDSKLLNYRFGGSYSNDSQFLSIMYESLSNEYGVPGGFVGAHPNGADIHLNKNDISITYESDMDISFIQSIKKLVRRSHYYHAEYESNNRIASEFANTNYNFKSIFEQKQFVNDFISLNGKTAVEFNLSNYRVGAFVKSPDVNLKSFAISTYQYFNLLDFDIQFGLRVQNDKFEPLTKEYLDKFSEKNLTSLGTSLMITKNIVESLDIITKLYTSEKSPTFQELFSEGPHLAAYSYDVGNINLNKESAAGIEFSLMYKYKNLIIYTTGFYNNFNSFTITRNTGDTNYRLLLPIFRAEQVPASIYGYEILSEYSFSDFVISFNYAKSIGLINSKEFLPWMPPDKSVLSLKYNNDNLNCELEFIHVGEQNRLAQFETISKSYNLINFKSSYSFFAISRLHTISLSVENLLNAEYRNHLSRLKEIMPEPGINVRFLINIKL